MDTGLARRGLGKETGKFYLLDNVRSAISNHFEHKYQEKLANWHDKTAVKELHIQLIDYYQDEKKGYGINSSFEVCYHRMMTRTNFEREFSVRREMFADLALGSMSLDHNEKFRVCDLFSSLSNEQISALIDVLIEEKTRLSTLISQELYNELTYRLKQGESNRIIQDLPLLLSLTKTEKFQNNYSLYQLIGDAYDDKGEYDHAIESYQKAVAINPQKDEAYSNLFELQLILNRPFDPILEERYVSTFHDHKEIFIKYEMLKIIHSIVLGDPVSIASWEEKYQEVSLGGWSFSELEQWNEAMETGTIKVSVTEAIERFKQKR